MSPTMITIFVTFKAFSMFLFAASKMFASDVRGLLNVPNK